MRSTDLTKQSLYEGVKTLIFAHEKSPHLQLTQPKLFTIYSLSFQYLLYTASKIPGAYILRIEDGILAEKLARKAKDLSTRNFTQNLLLPRKLKFQQSMLYLDFFNIGTWANTNDIPPGKIQLALVIKNTTSVPFRQDFTPEDLAAVELPKDYYYSHLQKFCPKTVLIAHENMFADVEPIQFSWIKSQLGPKTLAGVTLGNDMRQDDEDDD